MARDTDIVLDVSVRFPVRFTIIITVVVVVLTGTFYVISVDIKETMVFFGVATAGGGIIVAAFYTGRTLNLYLQQEFRLRAREEALDEVGKKEHALRYGERWNNPSMYPVRDVCRNIFEQRGKSKDELTKFIESNKTHAIHLLNFFEEIAYAIDNGLVDIDLMREQFRGIIIDTWQILEPWIGDRRIVRARPELWDAVQNLYDEWK